jgi:signal transduction histidine kinase
MDNRGGRIRLNVRDWGKGFAASRVPQGRRGLRGIQERVRLLNGKLAIKSEPGKGTSISVGLPILLPPKRAPV